MPVASLFAPSCALVCAWWQEWRQVHHNLSTVSPAASTSPISPTSSKQLCHHHSLQQTLLIQSQLSFSDWGRQSWLYSHFCSLWPELPYPLLIDVLAHQPQLLCYNHTRENCSWSLCHDWTYYDFVQFLILLPFKSLVPRWGPGITVTCCLQSIKTVIKRQYDS